MIDHFMLLTPLLLLPILLLFAFVGCALQTGGLYIPGPQAQATLLYFPADLTNQNITSLNVTFSLQENVPGESFPNSAPSQMATALPPWPAKTQDQITKNWPNGSVTASASYDMSCNVTMIDNNMVNITVANNNAKKSNITGNNINVTFELKFDIPSNSFTLAVV